MSHKEQLAYPGRFGLEKNNERHKKVPSYIQSSIKPYCLSTSSVQGTGQVNEDTTLSKKALVFYYHVKEKMDFICGTSQDMI